MQLRPILSTLRRHKITAVLLVAEIALTCAIICNAVFMISQRMQLTQIASGVAEQQLVMVQVANIGKQPDAMARSQQDLAALRRIAGVRDVSLVSQVPFGNSLSLSGVRTEPKQKQKQATLHASIYAGENLLQTFAVRLEAGRGFQSDEYLDAEELDRAGGFDKLAVVVITRALATHLWPGQSALGKHIYMVDTPLRVVGVVAALAWPSNFNGNHNAQWSVVLPLRMDTSKATRFVLRTAPENRQKVLAAAAKTLRKLDSRRIILEKKTLQQMRTDFFRNDRAMVGILFGVIIALLTVTALGIVGLASFWVAQRRHTIGIRRALGATRADILHYFQTENFLLASIGIALGMMLAYGLNLFLMQHYELPRLPLIYLPIGALALWLLGQLAVLGPALRAARVPPVVATRAV